MLAAVRGRILIVGVSAWLLGAGAATGGSLLAVSLIGQGMTGFSGQQMTGAAVNRALGAATGEPGAGGPAASTPSATSSAASKPPATQPPANASSPSSSSPAQAVASPSVTPGAQATSPSTNTNTNTNTGTSPASDGTVLTSQGGEVVAACQPAGAYLMSWSPQQGYEVNGVVRGPAATAKVTFESAANAVTMLVTCSGGVPSATSYVHSGGGPTDE